MFGLRRRHRKATAAPAAASEASGNRAIRLSEEQLFDAVRGKLDDFMGIEGAWALVRRDPDAPTDDTIFASMSTFSLARDITSMLVGGAAEIPSASPTVAAAPDARPSLRPVPRDESPRDQVEIELTTIAQWADPKHHDPDFVDKDIVSPVPAVSAHREAHGA